MAAALARWLRTEVLRLYRRLWSDPIIHRIHDRVLRHIKGLAESE
jgi:hypothetical protein